MKMEKTECSETSAYKTQTPGNYPEENIQHSEQGESLKSRNIELNDAFLFNVHYTQKKSMANLRLIDKLTVPHDTSTPYMAGSADLTSLQNPEASGLKQRLMACFQ